MSKPAATARWLTLCVLGILTVFAVNIWYSRKITTQVDGLVNAISQNSAASVVYLATVTESIRLTSMRAALARPESASDDRASIERSLTALDESFRAYRQTDDYPGERELYLNAEAQHGPLVSALERAMATVTDPQEHAESLARLGRTANDYAATIQALSQLNAGEIGKEGTSITEVRHRARAVSSALRIVMVVLAIVGILLSWITSRQHIALVESNERLAEDRAQELEMFAGRVAHDLRAPLSVIELKSAVADRSDSIDTMRSALQVIKKQGRRMQEIIDALLSFAQAGALPEPAICPNVAEVVKDVVGDAQSTSAGAGIEFVADQVRPVAAVCSARVLAIVLTNLVGNATKYIGAGSGGVKRVTLRTRENGSMLKFEVEDTGPGLPSGKEQAVFEPFVQLSRGSGGIGLGLATVKRLIEAHGGLVGVTSATGSGCTFWFELPMATTAETPRQPVSTPSASAAS
ncbi:MAG TPA: HAMP domain-containing sensor histidine kinase [Polyangiaceae bacterium]|jgi:signal transduction histidine kinase